MTPRKLKVGICRFPYGGTGGTNSEVPEVGEWVQKVLLETGKDRSYSSRIEDIIQVRYSDTPVTMTRNAAMHWALDEKVDVLVMVDSDQAPDLYLGGEGTKAFFQSSFDYLYDHYDTGPVAIFAPYCGPPGHPVRGGSENVYVFRWERDHTGHMEDIAIRLGQYSRTEAALMSGIVEAGAGPTGLCMIDMRIASGKGLACGPILKPPYFEYEWEEDGPKCEHCGQPAPGPRRKKSSTEDVTFFRELSFSGLALLGYNPVLCNWDAWAGHWKPWCVGKPDPIKASDIHKQFSRAVQQNIRNGDKLVRVVGGRCPEGMQEPRPTLAELSRTVPPRNRVQELLDSVRGNGHAQVAGADSEAACGAAGSPQETATA